MRAALVVLLAANAALAAEPIRLEPVGVVDVRPGTKGLRARLGPDGRWLVVAGPAREDRERNSWSYAGYSLLDLRRPAVVHAEPKARIGRNMPVFSRDGRWMAWCTDGHVHRRELATGETASIPLDAARPPRGFATACAIDERGRRIVLAWPGPGRREVALRVFDAVEKRAIARFPDFREPYFGGVTFEVVLQGDVLLYHSRPPDGVSGSDYRLLVCDPGTGEVRHRHGAYVANATARYYLTRDGRTLFNGTGAYELQRVDVRNGEAKTLCNTHDALYSHFLEVTVSPDENTILCWSRSREGIVAWDRAAGARSDIPTGEGGEVLGVAADNRHAILVAKRRLHAIDLATRRRVGALSKETWDWVRLDPTGRILLGGRKRRENAGSWRLHVFRVAGPDR